MCVVSCVSFGIGAVREDMLLQFGMPASVNVLAQCVFVRIPCKLFSALTLPSQYEQISCQISFVAQLTALPILNDPTPPPGLD